MSDFDHTIDGFRVLFKGLYIHQDAVSGVSKVLSMDAGVEGVSEVVFQLDKENHEYIHVFWFDSDGEMLDLYIFEVGGTQMVFDDALRALQTLIKTPYSIESNTD